MFVWVLFRKLVAKVLIGTCIHRVLVIGVYFILLIFVVEIELDEAVLKLGTNANHRFGQ